MWLTTPPRPLGTIGAVAVSLTVGALASYAVLCARLDLDLITRERDQEPALGMRQADLYRPEAVHRLGTETAGDR